MRLSRTNAFDLEWALMTDFLLSAWLCDSATAVKCISR